MPERKYRKKRRYRRRRYRKKNSLVLKKSPVPKIMFTKLRYCENVTLNPAAGGIDIKVYSANGCYDPYYTGTGHQPRGFDQLMTLYDHFVVLGSKCTVEAAPGSGTPLVMGVNLRDTTVSSGNPNDYQEGGYCTSKLLGTGTSAGTKRLVKTFSAKKFLGRSNVLSDSELKGSAIANPTEGAYYHIWASPADSTSDPTATALTVRIDYLVALIEPKTPTQS